MKSRRELQLQNAVDRGGRSTMSFTVAEIIDLPADSDLAEKCSALTRHRNGPTTAKNGQTDPGTGNVGSRDHPGRVVGGGCNFCHPL